MLEINRIESCAASQLWRKVLQLVVGHVQFHQAFQPANGAGQLADIVFTNAQVGQLGEVSNLVANFSDTIEAQVQRGHVVQLVHHSGNLGEPIMA